MKDLQLHLGAHISTIVTLYARTNSPSAFARTQPQHPDTRLRIGRSTNIALSDCHRPSSLYSSVGQEGRTKHTDDTTQPSAFPSSIRQKGGQAHVDLLCCAFPCFISGTVRVFCLRHVMLCSACTIDSGHYKTLWGDRL